MPRRASVVAAISATSSVLFNGAGRNWPVLANNGHLYLVYIDHLSDVCFVKSTNGGLTWSTPTVIFAGSATAVANWYDRWSGISGDLIHVAYQESGTDDTLYRTIDTASSDALSTQTVVLAGTSTAGGGCLAITRSRGGNVYCATMIDAGAEGGFMRLPNANVPNGAWDAARATVFEAATQDQVILVPGFAADNQDIMALFWDASANEISRKVYDDSANSWAETSIATSFNDVLATTAHPNYDACVDLDNNRIVMVAWDGYDAANADLRCWTITESAITESGDEVVLNGTDDQGLCNIALDTVTGDWWVVYTGKSDGSETIGTSVNVYGKVSKDDGATWGTETLLTDAAGNWTWISTPPRFTGKLPVAHFRPEGAQTREILANVDHSQPRATMLVGV